MFSRKLSITFTLFFLLFLIPTVAVFSAESQPSKRAVTFTDGCWYMENDMRGCVYLNEKGDNKATGSNHLGAGISVLRYDSNKYCIEVPKDYAMSGITISQSEFIAGEKANCYTITSVNRPWRIDFGLIFVGEATPAPSTSTAKLPTHTTWTTANGCWDVADLRGCIYTNDRNAFNKADGSNGVGYGFKVEVYDDVTYCVKPADGYAVNGRNVNQGGFIVNDGCHTYMPGEWRVDFGVAFVGVPTVMPTPGPSAATATGANGCYFLQHLNGCVYFDETSQKKATGGNHVGPGIAIEVRGDTYCLLPPAGYVVSGYNLNQSSQYAVTGVGCYTNSDPSVYRVDFAISRDPNNTPTPQPTATAAAATATPLPATATAIAANTGNVEVISINKKDTCSWEIHIKITNFTPSSLLAENTTGTETNCAGETYDVTITAALGQFISTDANGTAEWIQTVKEYGTYTATYTDAAGKVGTVTYTVAP